MFRTSLVVFSLLLVLSACEGSGGGDAQDTGPASDTDAASDAVGDAVSSDTDLADSAVADDVGPDFWPPDGTGPYSVGHREITMVDESVDPPARSTVGVWYPTLDTTGDRTVVLFTETGSYEGAPIADGTFPLVMFSHGSQGANFQSFTLYEHLASHGLVIAAPDHRGNMISDNPSDEEMAEVAGRRPEDVMLALRTVEAHADLGPATAGTSRAISGHSFGGYTALVLAGGTVDRDAALARCEAGTDSDVFCPYVPYWPEGSSIQPPEGADVFQVALVLAPGGYAAFGDDGLANIDIPVMIMGGTIDEFTLSDIGPIFESLPTWTLSILVERGGHMMFTDICRLPFAGSIPDLAELCDPETHIETDRGFEITNTYATAFLTYELYGNAEMLPYLQTPPAIDYPEATLDIRNAP